MPGKAVHVFVASQAIRNLSPRSGSRVAEGGAAGWLLISILHGYQVSAKFDALAERTKRNYVRIIRIIEREFGDFPLSALTERAARGVFMEWRDKLAQRSRRQADYAWVILGAVLSWALDRGLVVANPCQRGGLSRLAA
jgi:hypothetical protein